jgi:hypothetical protein
VRAASDVRGGNLSRAVILPFGMSLQLPSSQIGSGAESLPFPCGRGCDC